MKQAIVLIIFVAAGFAGGIYWMKQREAAPPSAAEHSAAAAAPANKEAAGPQVSRDTNGNAVIAMSEKTQKDLGIQVKGPEALQLSPELKGYGKVLDPAPLAALVTELATAQAASTASSSELARLKTLEGQGNASARALQTAEAAALRDLMAIQSARERLTLSWGKAVADQKDLPAFVQSLTSLEAALVRIDLPVAESLQATPAGARLVTLSGQSSEARFVEPAPNADPQMQGQGFIFLLKPNSLGLAAGASVVGYLTIPGKPLAGVVIPRDAVVRAEGAGWVYVLNATGDAFTRTEIALDHPTEAGWFVTKSVTAADRVVVTGAQQLLSFEIKSRGRHRVNAEARHLTRRWNPRSFRANCAAGRTDALFPLTPALSLRERERCVPHPAQTEALRFIVSRDAILPLPKGEGWGEGEETARNRATRRFSNHHRDFRPF